MCHVMSAPIAGRVGPEPLCRPSQLQSHLSEMATASKRKRSAENSNNYAAGCQFGVPTTYIRVNDFGQLFHSIFRGVTYTWERLIGEYIRDVTHILV